MIRRIATTSLLIATTASLANAATPTAIDWTDATTVLTWNNTTDSGNTDHNLDKGRAAFGSITIDGVSYTTIDCTKYDWQISFTLDYCTSTTDAMLFSTAGGGNGSGYRILVTASGETYSTSLNLNTDINSNNKTHLTGTETGSSSDCSTTAISNCTLSSTQKDTIALTWVASEQRLYLSVESSADTAGSTSSTKWIAYNNLSTDYLCLTTSSNITDASPSGTIFWGNGNGDDLHNISLKVHAVSAIPEPSAFGLLAGLGALAIAVSRRRRTR